ncbi:MAG: hypothetical protein ABI577_15395 [bacterium]
MRRQSIARSFVALPLAFALLLGACGDGPTQAPTPTPTPASDRSDVEPVGLPVLGPAVQQLTFVGIVEGTLEDADASCAWFHGSSPEKGRLQVLLQGFFGGARHSLRIVVNGYTGPGDYSWDGVPGSGPEVTIEVDSKEKGHATVFVADPGDGGEIEATITSPDQGRITGLFQCPGIPK